MGVFAISGAASGIGAATRNRIERAGNDVIGIDLDGCEVVADLGSTAGRAGAVAGVLELSSGRLDGLVTAAGVGPPLDPATIVSINYFGSQALLDGLRPALTATGDAQAVAVSSNSTTVTPSVPAALVAACLDGDEDQARALLAERPDAGSPGAMIQAYAASKIAIAHWVRRNAPGADWAGAGVRLNAIAPGSTLTPLLEHGLEDDTFGPLISGFAVPTGAHAAPDEIAAWIEQMLIGDGRRFLCGTVLFVDGGTDALVRPNDWPAPYAL
ncbi:MAG: SDR family oxidoreductase [Acidimicrobiia bacterium]|nr:SDR family oxidoreductase [Acidimicrobiia bacterium]